MKNITLIQTKENSYITIPRFLRGHAYKLLNDNSIPYESYSMDYIDSHEEFDDKPVSSTVMFRNFLFSGTDNYDLRVIVAPVDKNAFYEALDEIVPGEKDWTNHSFEGMKFPE